MEWCEGTIYLSASEIGKYSNPSSKKLSRALLMPYFYQVLNEKVLDSCTKNGSITSVTDVTVVGNIVDPISGGINFRILYGVRRTLPKKGDIVQGVVKEVSGDDVIVELTKKMTCLAKAGKTSLVKGDVCSVKVASVTFVTKDERFDITGIVA